MGIYYKVLFSIRDYLISVVPFPDTPYEVLVIVFFVYRLVDHVLVPSVVWMDEGTVARVNQSTEFPTLVVDASTGPSSDGVLVLLVVLDEERHQLQVVVVLLYVAPRPEVILVLVYLVLVVLLVLYVLLPHDEVPTVHLVRML